MIFNRIFPLLLLLFLYSCKNTSSVVGKSGFQKRKYQRGWHIEGRSSLHQNQKSNEECLSENIVPVELDELDTLTHVVPESTTETVVEAKVSRIVPFLNELIAVNSQAVFASEKSYGQADFGMKKKKSKKAQRKIQQ